jgi:hypothetical protein
LTEKALKEIQEAPLPKGAQVVERAPVEPDRDAELELAAELAQRGASEEFIEIVGGKAAVQAARRIRNGSNGSSNAGQRTRRRTNQAR